MLFQSTLTAYPFDVLVVWISFKCTSKFSSTPPNINSPEHQLFELQELLINVRSVVLKPLLSFAQTPKNLQFLTEIFDKLTLSRLTYTPPLETLLPSIVRLLMVWLPVPPSNIKTASWLLVEDP